MESRDWSSDVCSSDLFPSHDTGVGDGLVSDIINVQKFSKIKKISKKNYLLIKVMYLNKYTSVVKLRYLKNGSYRVNKEKELLVFL